MARSLWKGAISFGLVHIPVELHTAIQNHDLDLTMLDKRDFSPIGFRRYNKGTGKEVTWDNIVKGYEYMDGEYVVLSDEDLRQANPKATQTIDILAFVDADSVPLTFYETPYYLSPGRGGDKVYALLRETLKKAAKVAVATVVIRTKQHLCALVAVGNGIIMNTLRYATEIRSPEDLKLPGSAKASGITDKELQMALSLVEGMSDEWNPKDYHDTYREDVLKLVDKKVKAGQTKTITQPSKEEAAPKASNVVDLVALLKQSLGGAKPSRQRKGGADTESEETEEVAEEEEAEPAKPRRSTTARNGSSRTASGRSTTSARKTSTTHAATKAAAKRAATKTPARRKAA
ncbi:non-homologous end joining protein Ku [Pseudoduganella sp. RAF53_2]|uniref:non-homologous end joining protein Ku n=1 Tax=unclassified Pseudoduganella TaxID=2637179 RepID=UPI003F9AB844